MWDCLVALSSLHLLAFERSGEAILPAWEYFFYYILSTSLLSSNQNQALKCLLWYLLSALAA